MREQLRTRPESLQAALKRLRQHAGSAGKKYPWANYVRLTATPNPEQPLSTLVMTTWNAENYPLTCHVPVRVDVPLDGSAHIKPLQEIVDLASNEPIDLCWDESIATLTLWQDHWRSNIKGLTATEMPQHSPYTLLLNEPTESPTHSSTVDLDLDPDMLRSRFGPGKTWWMSSLDGLPFCIQQTETDPVQKLVACSITGERAALPAFMEWLLMDIPANVTGTRAHQQSHLDRRIEEGATQVDVLTYGVMAQVERGWNTQHLEQTGCEPLIRDGDLVVIVKAGDEACTVRMVRNVAGTRIPNTFLAPLVSMTPQQQEAADARLIIYPGIQLTLAPEYDTWYANTPQPGVRFTAGDLVTLTGKNQKVGNETHWWVQHETSYWHKGREKVKINKKAALLPEHLLANPDAVPPTPKPPVDLVLKLLSGNKAQAAKYAAAREQNAS